MSLNQLYKNMSLNPTVPPLYPHCTPDISPLYPHTVVIVVFSVILLAYVGYEFDLL